MQNLIDRIKFNEKGLIPAILQDVDSREVLMLAYMNKASIKKTVETGKACFWSRSRQQLWVKGESSGNYQEVEEIRYDCDIDTLLLLVKPAGPACHTGEKTCFYRKLPEEALTGIKQLSDQSKKCNNTNRKQNGIDQESLYKASFLFKLYNTIAGRKENPVKGSYTNYLFDKGVDKICKKVGEEAAEVIIAAKNASQEEMVYEIGDLIYHLMVLMNLYKIPLTDILEELESRSQ